MPSVSEEPHSAAYFGPERDFWWNHDHLEARTYDEAGGMLLYLVAGRR